MAYGMPPGFEQLLARKYDIQQQQVDIARINALSNQTSANAGARLDNTRADLLPDESAANIGQTQAQTGLIREQAKYFGPSALANIALQRAEAGRATASAGLIGEQTTSARQLNKLYKLNDQLGAFPSLDSNLRTIQGRR